MKVTLGGERTLAEYRDWETNKKYNLKITEEVHLT